jgi:large subunit ribosomal protein L9
MDIILKADVAHLGKAGDIVKVKDGYARNFLIPEGLAYHATDANKRRIAGEEGRRANKAASEQTAAEERAQQLRQISLTFTAKTGEGDRLFGSVTSADIAAKLAEAGHQVDKRTIDLEEPIRAIGVYQVGVRLHPAVRGEVRVWVVRE